MRVCSCNQLIQIAETKKTQDAPAEDTTMNHNSLKKIQIQMQINKYRPWGGKSAFYSRYLHKKRDVIGEGEGTSQLVN